MAIDFSLNDKIALINGGSRGIGEAIAHEFARRGATVVISSRRQSSLDKVVDAIQEEGGKAVAIACHAGRSQQIEALFEKIRDEFGRLDILVNNAGTNPFFGPAHEIPEKAYDKTMEINLKGYFLMSQHAARMMLAQKSGSIINVASVTGLSASPNQVTYSMTKAAVISMTQGMAKELGPAGVRVNAIAPGLIETKLASGLLTEESLYKSIINATPLRRHGQPDEIAGAALYLASDASAFTTGHVMVCDGGMYT